MTKRRRKGGRNEEVDRIGWDQTHYKPQARFSGDSDVGRRDLRIFLEGRGAKSIVLNQGLYYIKRP